MKVVKPPPAIIDGVSASVPELLSPAANTLTEPDVADEMIVPLLAELFMVPNANGEAVLC